MTQHLFERTPTSSSQFDHSCLQIEQLEDRVLLSTVQIFAAGATGEELMRVNLNGPGSNLDVVEVGGNAAVGEFVEFRYDVDQQVDINKVVLNFINDAYDPSTGLDRNLTVDKVVVDGVVYEAEAANVYSTGTFDGNALISGYGLGDTLYGNGQIVFGTDPADGRQLKVRASGSTGEELLHVKVRNTNLVNPILATFVAPQGEPQDLFVTVNGDFDAGDVEIEFFNDLYQPEIGFDRNLRVDYVEVDGERFETEGPLVFSSGTYIAGEGVIARLGAGSEYLHANGTFRYSAFANDTVPPTVELGSTFLTTTPQAEIAFEILFRDNEEPRFPVGDPFTVLAPDGTTYTARSRNGGPVGDGSLVVVYVLRKQSGVWDNSDNGEYIISLQENFVQDAAGNFAPAQVVGSFVLNVDDVVG